MEIVVGLFATGLVLWWIIKSDLEKIGFQKRMREQNEKTDARAEADRREAKIIQARGKVYSERRERHLKLCRDQCPVLKTLRGISR